MRASWYDRRKMRVSPAEARRLALQVRRDDRPRSPGEAVVASRRREWCGWWAKVVFRNDVAIIHSRVSRQRALSRAVEWACQVLVADVVRFADDDLRVRSMATEDRGNED